MQNNWDWEKCEKFRPPPSSQSSLHLKCRLFWFWLWPPPPSTLWTFSTICDIFCLEGSPKVSRSLLSHHFFLSFIEIFYFYFVGEMGASLICLNYRSQNLQATPPSKWMKLAIFGLKIANFDFVCIWARFCWVLT